ncbi:hypothetical protein [Oryzihumus leptocrescens]|uniref:hypothetical protein n=1 Tax=Oryzihumus leptocrescens TaxID=297536 RepID=UPI0031E0780F
MDENESGTERARARARLLNSVVVGVLRAVAEQEHRAAADPSPRVTDVAVGLGAAALDGSRRVTTAVGLAVRPVAAMLAPPAAVRERPARWLRDLAERGRAEREATALRLDALGRRVAPRLVDQAMGYVDVTDLVKDHVDLDALVATVDLDAAVARVDMDAILDRVDIDEIASRLDLGPILDRVDVNGIAAKLDLGPIVDKVDIDEIASRLDLDAVVSRLDLVALAEVVAEGLDLPAIIQSSSGSMASEALREVRWHGIGADERVANVVDKMLRRQGRDPEAPGQQPAVPEQPPGPAPSGPPAGASTGSPSGPPAEPSTGPPGDNGNGH